MRIWTSTLLTVTAAISMAALGATPLLAQTAGTWTVKPGGSFSGSGGLFTMIDTTTEGGFGCSPSGLSGTLKSGSGLAGSHLGSVTSMFATDCQEPAAYGFTFSSFPYVLSGSSYSSGTTEGTIAGIHAKGIGVGCHFVVDGTSATADNGDVVFAYSNSTGQLKLSPGGNLHVYQVSGCYGLFHDGDYVRFSDTFTLSSKQIITSL